MADTIGGGKPKKSVVSGPSRQGAPSTEAQFADANIGSCSPSSDASLYWLALGTFAVGTEGHMIAAILPRISADLVVSVGTAGQLVTIFALTYALSSPILTAFMGHFDRRRLLLAAMAAFAVTNVLAAIAPTYGSLAIARVLLAISAGLYVPNANALGSALVAPEKRGRALAIVSGGLGVAVAIGVPLGSLIGDTFGWRVAFVGVAVLAAVAFVGLLNGLPADVGKGLAVMTLRERLLVVRQPGALVALVQTTLFAMGAYAAYTYVALLLSTIAGFTGTGISVALFLFGVSAFLGILIGGNLSDRIGSRRVVALTMPMLAVVFIVISMLPHWLPVSEAGGAMLALVAVWGFASWGFFPAQQARLIGIAGSRSGPIALSLNASCLYLGFSLGAAAGSTVLTFGSAPDLGWASALFVFLSFALFLVKAPGSVRSMA